MMATNRGRASDLLLLLAGICTLSLAAASPKVAEISNQHRYGIEVTNWPVSGSGAQMVPRSYGLWKEGANIAQTYLDQFESESIKPGPSSYAGRPGQAARSLKPLLDLALQTIPLSVHASTPVMVGATAGLRLLPGRQARDILLATWRFIKSNYPLKVEKQNVLMISGAAEGGYGWAQVNYLKGLLGKPTKKTVAAIDMCGASMQQTFAMTKEEAAAAPNSTATSYVYPVSGSNAYYELYTHSYLGYGQKAARAAILRQRSAGGCMPAGKQGTYAYAGTSYPWAGMPGGPSILSCSTAVVDMMARHRPCGMPQQAQCTFDGAWGGSRVPAGVVLMSSSWWTAKDAGLVPDDNTAFIEITPRAYTLLAEAACLTPLAEYPTVFPTLAVDQYDFFCLDATYASMVLTQGFKFPEVQKLTAAFSLFYESDDPLHPHEQGQLVSAGWTMGAALTMLLGWQI